MSRNNVKAELPLEFSFKLNDGKFDKTFFATIHDHLKLYAVSWISPEKSNKIETTFYTANDVFYLVNKNSWVMLETFK